jgi:hypothetical protein
MNNKETKVINNVQDLLEYKDYKEGLKALYNTFDLQLSRESVECLKVDDNNIHLIDNYGWDLSQLWDLDRSIVVFLLPRLYVFYMTDFTLEQSFEEGSLKQIIETILEGFLLLLVEYNGYIFKNEEFDYKIAKIKEAFMLLGKYAQRLWN